MLNFLKQILHFCFMFFSLTQATYAAESTNTLLQKSLDTFRAKYQFGAVALTIIDPARSSQAMNFVSGFQKMNGRKLRESDYFQIGSNTKSMVAALLIKLQSSGRLSLKDPITKWLPQYPEWKHIRIENLLKNNSGIPSFSITKAFLAAEKADPYRQFTSADLINFVRNEPLLFNAGDGWDYSNTNWILAGMIAENATHKKMSHLLNQYFFMHNRLNLTNTIYWPARYSDKIMSRMVHGYDDAGIDITDRGMAWAGTAGGIIATNEDLAYWAFALFNGKALNSNELAIMQALVSTQTGKPLYSHKKNSAEKMTDPVGYGMGIAKRFTNGVIWWGHEGHTLGYHSLFAWFPEQDIIVTMHANGLKHADFKPFMMEIIKILDNEKLTKTKPSS